MKISFKFVIALALIAAGVAALAPSPGASSEHFVVVNDNDFYLPSQGNDFATVLRLEGTKQKPVLKQAALLNSGQPGVAQSSWVPTVQIVRIGADICVFMADSAGPQADTPNEITSFRYPSMTPVGSFSDGQVSSSELGIVIAAHGDYLFAGYNGYKAASYLATWQIGSGCTLELLGTYEIPYQVSNMAATPSGNALLVSYYGDEAVDSFAIGAGGVLTETGPYSIFNAERAEGLDITADSKLAVFDTVGFGPPYDDGETEINTFVINSDGSLGQQGSAGGDGSLGKANGGGWIRLSPNEKFLFATSSVELTTLNFTENPVNVSYSGCLTTLRVPNGEPTVNAGTIATVGTAGAGTGIYVAENFGFSSIALLAVNPTTGCTSETVSSPFLLSDPNAGIWSLVAWPPRGF